MCKEQRGSDSANDTRANSLVERCWTTNKGLRSVFRNQTPRQIKLIKAEKGPCEMPDFASRRRSPG